MTVPQRPNSTFFEKNLIVITVIPRLTRLAWQPKNRVRRNSRYASQSVTFLYIQVNGENTIVEVQFSENTIVEIQF